jgi:predicted methyltransferase
MVDEVDLRAAINAVSDVIQNRPRPLREFDQIYMKAGDMVMQSQFVAQWSAGKSLAFIGDGDAISVCVAYLHARRILPYGPSRITVFDFDERIVKAVQRFADSERLECLDAVLYNCIDPMPAAGTYDLFYTNPPWGASNGGASVDLFALRGMEAVGFAGAGCIVIADDDDLAWPQEVLANVQAKAAARGFFVSRMMPQLHSYHLDDAPTLRSCNLIVRSRPGQREAAASCAVTDAAELRNFYGDGDEPYVRYVRERARVDYGKAPDGEYSFELLSDLEQP